MNNEEKIIKATQGGGMNFHAKVVHLDKPIHTATLRLQRDGKRFNIDLNCNAYSTESERNRS